LGAQSCLRLSLRTSISKKLHLGPQNGPGSENLLKIVNCQNGQKTVLSHLEKVGGPQYPPGSIVVPTFSIHFVGLNINEIIHYANWGFVLWMVYHSSWEMVLSFTSPLFFRFPLISFPNYDSPQTLHFSCHYNSLRPVSATRPLET
jgi:hypothetical protein